jgi:hypothetical protein
MPPPYPPAALCGDTIIENALARVLASSEVTPKTKRRLQQAKARLNPFALKHEMDRSLKSIAALRRERP